jgi:hypothetical protein
MNKLINIALALLLAASTCSAQFMGMGNRKLFTPPTWSYEGTAANSLSCSGTSCSITAPVGLQPGDVLVGFVAALDNTIQISSGSGGGGTWHVCTGCQIYNPAIGLQGGAIYSVDDTSTGTPSITVTLTSTQSQWSLVLIVFRCSGCSAFGSIAFDQTGSLALSASCSSCAGSAYTSLAGFDLLVSLTTNTVGGASISSPYHYDTSGYAYYALGTRSTSAPTITLPSVGAFLANGLAFKP